MLEQRINAALNRNCSSAADFSADTKSGVPRAVNRCQTMAAAGGGVRTPQRLAEASLTRFLPAIADDVPVDR